jgi:HD-GYP domain-containing protein (c-di-GMP phosphodiesterase class II)
VDGNGSVPQPSTTPVKDGDDPVTLITASRRYLIPIADLGLGMFVAELDRPWLDTPFLLQGFLADSQVEIDTLRKYCSYVYVDLELSNPEVADAIRRAEVRHPAPAAPPDARSPATALDRAPPTEPTTPPVAGQRPAAPATRSPRVYKTRSDVRISSDTRERFRQLVRATAGPRRGEDRVGPFGRLLGWLLSGLQGTRRRAPQGASERNRSGREASRAWLPPSVEPTRYEDTRTMEQELPRARSTFTRAEDVLKAIASDVKLGRIPQIADVAGVVDDMVASMIDHPNALMWVGRMRDEDPNTYNHAVKVSLYLIALGRQLGFPRKELCHLGLIGMLADVGKIKLPRALLDKPGMLAPSEFSLVKEHVRLGLDALRATGELPAEVERGIAQHHERLDGSGYPKGLKGSEISVYGRMAAIADSFAALITPRAYANPSAPQDALMNLYEWAGTSFHEPLVEQFVQAVGVFPVGSLVELSSGEVAIVVAHNRARRLQPRVLVLTGSDKSPLAEPFERDLLVEGGSARARLRIVRGLAAGAYGLKVRDYYLSGTAQTEALPA